MTIQITYGKGLLYIDLIQQAMKAADLYETKLPQNVINMVGMSGKKYRIFINHLMGLLKFAKYGEIGSWAGSTLLSAIYGNKCKAFVVDNWSEFDGPYDVFMKNLATYITKDTQVSILHQDYKTVCFENFEKRDVYLFDGPHTYQDQFEGMKLIDEICNDLAIVIVDDWNWENVRNGTLNGIAAINRNILYSVEIRTTDDNTHAEIHGANSDWHNGYFIACVSK